MLLTCYLHDKKDELPLKQLRIPEEEKKKITREKKVCLENKVTGRNS